jgi:hypothetical protein
MGDGINIKNIHPELAAQYTKAVKMLNTGGAKTAMEAYKVLTTPGRNLAEEKHRKEKIPQLNQLGRAWFAIAGVMNFVNRAKLQNIILRTSFGGVRVMFAVPARGTHYLFAVDITVDVNGGVVATQWITRQPVSAQNIPILLAGKTPTLCESELDGDYFEKYSEINAITSGMRRTPEAMEKAVLTRLAEKIKQMRGC